MNIADALILTLRDFGVRYIFGVSGANIEHVHDALHRLGNNDIQSVFCKTESGAAFMADAYARETGSIGVCCATSGGGMLNLVAGVAEAQASAVPMLAIVGQAPTALEGIGGFQDTSGLGDTIDAFALMKSVSQYALKISSSDQFWEALEAALLAACTGRKGAAVLLLPRDIQEQIILDRPAGFLEKVLNKIHNTVTLQYDLRSIAQFKSMQQQAKKTLLIVGEALMRSSAVNLLKRFALRNNLYIAATLGNVCAFSALTPHFIGCVGVAGHVSVHRFIADEADLIIAVGTQLELMTRGPVEEHLKKKKLVVINAVLNELPNVLEADLRFEMEPATFLALVVDLPGNGKDKTLKKLKIERQQVWVRESQLKLKDSQLEGHKLGNSAALAVINRYLPNNCHLLFDAGNCAATAAHRIIPPSGSNSSIALGMGGMGYAVAAAIGNSLAKKQKAVKEESLLAPTVVFCGDGAFLMNGNEVHTAVEWNLPILWLVFNDNKHGMCSTRQEIYFAKRYENSVFQRPVSISKIAEGLGGAKPLRTCCVYSEKELEIALKQYFSFGCYGPYLIEILINVDELPPFTPFLASIPEGYVPHRSTCQHRTTLLTE